MTVGQNICFMCGFNHALLLVLLCFTAQDPPMGGQSTKENLKRFLLVIRTDGIQPLMDVRC